MSVRYLLDSDICIYAMKRQPRLVRRFDTLAARCALSVVSYGELCFGQAASKRPIEAGAHLAALLETIQVLPMPVEAAAKYGDIRAQLERAGRPIGGNDLWIAAHALAAGLILITNNEREFARVPGLRLENWAK